LLELALIFDEKVLDGIFDGDDAQGERLVEPLEQRTNGRALALAGRAGDE